MIAKQIATIQSRVRIGFKDKKLWRNAHAVFSSHALKILGHPVMEDWEKYYMKALADIATFKGGAIVEVGFGMGISAAYIQKRVIQSHTIMEANKEVAARARTFAKKSSVDTRIVDGFWEDTIRTIDDASIDGILFDTYPLSEVEIHKNHFAFFPHAYRILKPGGILSYYSDEHSAFSSEHMRALKKAGFDTKEKVQGIRVYVEPPEDCLYWKHDTILAPIVVK